MCDGVFQRGCSIAFAGVCGVERLLLCRYGGLQTQAIIMLGEPGVEGHGGEEHSEEDSRDFECVAHSGVIRDS